MLCDAEILRAIECGFIGIEPFDRTQLNTNSYDVRLGNWFYLVSSTGDGPVFKGPHWVNDGELIEIPRGQTLLGMTKELIGTRHNVVAELRSKSTTRRCGITVCDDAGFGDVGYWNHWTVELTAHVLSTRGPYLVVGGRFAQAVFFSCGVPINEYSGQYCASDWPINMIPKKYRDCVWPWGGDLWQP